MVAYVSYEGYVSFHNEDLSSWSIQDLTEVFIYNKEKEKDLLMMFTEIKVAYTRISFGGGKCRYPATCPL